MTDPNVQQFFILPEESKRTKGQDAQRTNIQAARLVADMVRTTLGPKGMDKMIVDAAGDITVTNDGVTILNELFVSHPTAKMIVEIARTQEKAVGDGTTTAVILAGELLKEAENLLDQDIHPSIIAKGFLLAADEAKRVLDQFAKIATKDDLINVAATAITGKGAESAKDYLSAIIVSAIQKVTQDGTMQKNAIKIQPIPGKSTDKSELLEGIVLDKERVHSMMPTRIQDAKVLLLDAALEIQNTETDAKISITDPTQLQAFLDMEEMMLEKMTKKIISSGATTVFCQKGIDQAAQNALAKAGILAARRVKKSDMERLTLATNAPIISRVDDISSQKLGFAGLIEEVNNFIHIKKCQNPRALTILACASTEHAAAEVERAIEDALGVVGDATHSKILPGAGAPEIMAAQKLRDFSNTLSGREQLAVQAFAKALEIIPRTLAENAGIDSLDALTALKAAHGRGEHEIGIDVFTGKTINAKTAGILEPLKIKTQALSSATDVANMILRIDDIIMNDQKVQQ